MTAGNQHSENNNERKATLEKQTNKQNVQTVPCTGSVSKQCIRILQWTELDRAAVMRGFNRVRLASDRASTDCWQRPCPVSSCKCWCEPQKMLRTPEHSPSVAAPPPPLPLHLSPSSSSLHPQVGLTSPHQNVRWQNRKAAVCSRHLKVHLHTLPARLRQPTAISAKAVGYRGLCSDQHMCGFQLLLFLFFVFQTVYVCLHF